MFNSATAIGGSLKRVLIAPRIGAYAIRLSVACKTPIVAIGRQPATDDGANLG
jgi:hypothetical protein